MPVQIVSILLVLLFAAALLVAGLVRRRPAMLVGAGFLAVAALGFVVSALALA